MGRCIDLGAMRPQDPLFGISHKNIVHRLDRSNWRTKAVVRMDESGALYIFVQKGREADAGPYRYYVRPHTFPNRYPVPYCADFARLEDALAFINGEDGGALARETRPAEPAEYPRSSAAPWHFTTLPRWREPR